GACRGRRGGVPRRAVLRPRRRHPQCGRDPPPLPGQGKTLLQSPHLACRRSHSGSRHRPFRYDRDRARRGLLAGTADAGAAEDDRLLRGGTRDRGTRDHRDPQPLAPGCTRDPGAPRPSRGGAVGRRVVAPSANLSGHVSPTTSAHVQSDLAGRIDLIVDGGPVEVGIESTIVGCFDAPMLLRPGGLPREAIERVLDRALLQPPADAETDNAQPLAPGMLASHYAPRTRVRLNATSVEAGEALLAFGPPAT